MMGGFQISYHLDDGGRGFSKLISPSYDGWFSCLASHMVGAFEKLHHLIWVIFKTPHTRSGLQHILTSRKMGGFQLFFCGGGGGNVALFLCLLTFI